MFFVQLRSNCKVWNRGLTYFSESNASLTLADLFGWFNVAFTKQSYSVAFESILSGNIWTEVGERGPVKAWSTWVLGAVVYSVKWRS